MTTFEEAIEPVKQQFMRRRVAAFARKHEVENNDVEVVDNTDVSFMEKEFKRNNNIKTRLYKNMTEEQQKAWVIYYNDHKDLSLRVKAGADAHNNSTSSTVSKHKKAEKVVNTADDDAPVKIEKDMNLVSVEPLKPAKQHKKQKSESKVIKQDDAHEKAPKHDKTDRPTDKTLKHEKALKPDACDKTPKHEKALNPDRPTDRSELKKPRKIVHHRNKSISEK